MVLDFAVEGGGPSVRKQAQNLKSLLEKQRNSLTDREVRHSEAALALVAKYVY